MPDLQIQFMRNPVTGESKQEEFFFLTNRNQCFSGGYGNGKTYIGCFKAYTLLSTFPKYRMAIVRASATDLKRTTMATFFKICPPEAYSKGGRADTLNRLILDNGSEVFWMHLENYDESAVRGLEINSYLIDQAEEVEEHIYLHLDSRLDRWDMAEVPPHLQHLPFKKNPVTGKLKPPAYGMILCNPDAFTHWIYRRYHPDSSEHTMKRTYTNAQTGEKIEYAYSDTHKMIQATSYDNPALSQETLQAMSTRGPAFFDRFVLGKWGTSGGAIHYISGESKLYDVPRDFLEHIVRHGAHYFALDHGDVSPTCGLWFIKFKHWIFCWREYYKANELISTHRKNIGELNTFHFSGEQHPVYLNPISVCDPSMFNKTQQKKGGRQTLADEYKTTEYKAPPIHFQPADNDEYITRSRISEALTPHSYIKHPITGAQGAPVLYFLMRSENFPFGVHYAVDQTAAQAYEKLGTENGEDIYGDERDDKIVDHAYDALRYAIARMNMYGPAEVKPLVDHDATFTGARKRAIRMQRQYKRIAGIQPHSFGKTY
jgi:hypothetical protein